MNLSEIISIKQDNRQKKNQCDVCKYKDRTFVPSYIGGNDLVIVGEAPGKTEAEKLIPFIGESGQLLREVLKEVGFDVDKVSFLNSCHCHPPNNETPDKKSRMLCTKLFLSKELSELQPKLVVLAGSTALECFFPDKKITDKRGNFLNSNGFTFLPVYHPSYCLRNASFKPTLRKDLKKAEMFLNGTLTKEREYTIVSSIDEIDKYTVFLKSQNILSFDIETPEDIDFNPFHEKAAIWTIAFGYDTNKAICFPLQHPDMENVLFKEQSWNAVKDILASPVKKVCHNGSFDIKFCKKFGLEVTNFYMDTMIMSFLLDENRNSYSLKPLSSEYLQGYLYTYTANDFGQLCLYNCEDADNTLQLYYKFFAELKKFLKMISLLKHILIPMSLVVVDMEFEGILIDIPYVKKLDKIYQTKLDSILQLIEADYPESKGVDLNSPKQVAELLFDTYKFNPVKQTATKRNSVDEEVLKVLAGQGYKIARYLLKLRRYEKLLSTYIRKMPDIVGSDNRLRGSFNLIGARTGRTSSSDPNMQNFPRDKEVKKMFTAREGYSLVNVDASQAELRIGCSIANEQNMIDAYNKGIDIHRLTASRSFNKKVEDVTKDERQKAKSCNFGFLYGASAEGYQRLAESDYGLKLKLSECIDFRNKFFTMYPGLITWYEMTREQVKKYGYVEYPTGRLRRFPDAKGRFTVDDDVFRQAVNSPVQGSSSDVILYTIVQLWRRIKERDLFSFIVSTVHDSILVESKDAYVPYVIENIRDIANNDIPKQFPWLKVPMVFDFSVGKNWGEMEEIK